MNSQRRGATEDPLVQAARAEAEGWQVNAATIIPGKSAIGSRPTISIPGYELLGEPQRGGQGVVYQGLQISTGRKAAIKVLHQGPFAGPGDRARFEREIRILAQLKHPNIVTIHDGGVVAGNAYFVMDYIDGDTLDAWIADPQPVVLAAPGRSAQHRDRVDGKLKLFLKICEGVNAAHLRGIIHRDLKPSNIRIDRLGEPHVLDFGLAKLAIESDEASITATGEVVGSLFWSAPEQAEGAPDKIDMRTDVYALGVILFQLLTGQFPYSPTGGRHNVVERILHAEPPRPSLLRDGINDELDTIALKCLAKERDRRYQTAGDLARDLRNYLNGEPIEAKRDSTTYVVRKYLRRHRWGVAVAAGLVILLTLSSLAGWTLYVRAEQEAETARTERDKTAKFADFMQETLKGVGPSVALGRDTKMLKELMDGAAKRIEHGELRSVPGAELRLRLTIGAVYRDIADFDAAQRMLTPAVELADEVYGLDSTDRATALDEYAQWLEAVGRFVDALPRREEALAIRQRHFPGDHPDVASSLSSVAWCLQGHARFVEALHKHEEALAMRQRLFPGDHPLVAQGLSRLGSCLDSLARYAEALPRLQEALAMRQRLFPGDHPDVADSLSLVALCLLSSGRSTEALPTYEETLILRRRLFSGDHPDVAASLNDVGLCLYQLGRSREALVKYEESLAMYQRLFPGDHHHVANSLNNFGRCLESLGRPGEALPKLEASLAMWRRLFPGDHSAVAIALSNVGFCLDSLGRSAEALAKFEEALAMYGRVMPADHWRTRVAEVGKGCALFGLKRYGEAEDILVPAWEAIADRADVPKRRKARCLEGLVKLFTVLDAADPEKGYAKKAAEWRKKLDEMSKGQNVG